MFLKRNVCEYVCGTDPHSDRPETDVKGSDGGGRKGVKRCDRGIMGFEL